MGVGCTESQQRSVLGDEIGGVRTVLGRAGELVGRDSEGRRGVGDTLLRKVLIRKMNDAERTAVCQRNSDRRTQMATELCGGKIIESWPTAFMKRF